MDEDSKLSLICLAIVQEEVQFIEQISKPCFRVYSMEKKERKKDIFLTYVQQQEILRHGHRAGETYMTLALKYNVSTNVIGQLFRKHRRKLEDELIAQGGQE